MTSLRPSPFSAARFVPNSNPNDLDVLRWSLTDFRRIANFDPSVYQSLHTRDVSWLQHTMTEIAWNEPNRAIAVMTHHAPTVDGTGDPKYIGGLTNSAFAAELVDGACWGGAGEGVDVWAYAMEL